MHSTTTASTNQVRPCSNARRVPLRALLLALIVMTSLQQAALAAPSVPRTKTRTLDPWIECLKRPNGTFQYNPNPNFNVPQGFKDQLIPQFSGTLYACGTPVMSQLYFRMQVNRSGTPDPVPARRTQDGVLVDQLTPGDYVLTVEVLLTRTPEDARALRDATGDKPLPQVPLVPLNRPKIQQPFRIMALTPNIVPTTATNVRLSTQQTQSLTISFGANVNNMGPNKANWTCCVTGAPTGPCGGPCPDALRNQVSGTNNANVAIKVSDGKMLNVGLYRLTLTVGPANASFLISVESAAVVPIEVTQDFDQSKDAFMIFARTMQEAQVSWTVGGVDRPPADASGRSLRVPRGNLSTTMPTEVVVKATLKDGTSGTATIQLAPVIAPVVNCQATNAENPGQGNVQALTDLVRLRATVSGVPQDASLSYNFGFGRAPQSSASVGDDAAPVFVTPGPILTNEFNTTAPNVPVASPSNFQVPFFVEVVVNGQIKLRAACPLIVNPPVFGSPAQADALVKQQQQQFARAVDSGDNSAMVNAAANAMGLALAQGTAKTDESSRRQLEKDLAGNMATALRRTFGTENSTGRRTSDMTAEVKGNALDCLSQMSLAPLKPGAPPPADCNASCIAQLRQDVLDVISSAIAPGTDGTRIDMKTNAKKVLDLLSNVAPGRDTNAAVRSAAVALAAQVSVGETVVIASTDGKTKVAGKTIPATLVADLTSTVYEKLDSTTGGVSMSWPSGVMLPGAAAGSTVSLAATTLTTTPFPTTNGLPANVAASSSTTDFSVALDGLEQNVTNLGVPIKAEITRTPFSANAQTMVRYYDESTSSWSSAGITDVTYDPATGRVSFKTTHLTAFATFDTQTAADTPAPPVTTTAAGNATTTAAVAPATTMAIGGDASARTVVALAVCAAFALVVA